MKNYYESVETNHSPNWPYITDHPYKILIMSISELDMTNVLPNISSQILRNLICTSKMNLNQIINYLSTEEQKIGIKYAKI